MSGNKRVAAIELEPSEGRGRATSSPVGTYAQQREAKRLAAAAAAGNSTPGRAALSNGGANGNSGKQKHANWSESDDNRGVNSSMNMSRTDAKALVASFNVFAKVKRRIKKLAPRTQLNLTFAVIELFMIGAFILQSTASSTAVYQNYSASATDAIGGMFVRVCKSDNLFSALDRRFSCSNSHAAPLFHCSSVAYCERVLASHRTH
jgi:hypothetical protein